MDLWIFHAIGKDQHFGNLQINYITLLNAKVIISVYPVLNYMFKVNHGNNALHWKCSKLTPQISHNQLSSDFILVPLLKILKPLSPTGIC